MPSRKAYPPPSRASARVRSRASSVSGEAEDAKTIAISKGFDKEFILYRLLVANEYGRVSKLTKANITALLKVSVEKRRYEATNRDLALSAKNDELAAANELLLKERDAAREEASKRHLRDVFRRDDLMAVEIKREAEALAQRMMAEELEKRSSVTVSTALVSSGSRAPASDFSTSPAPASEPAPSPVASSSSSSEASVSRPRQSASLLRRVLTGVASPFFRGSTSPQRHEVSPARQEPALGELPAARKRPHEEAESASEVTTPTKKRNMPAPRSLVAPATMPTSLSTISERAGPTERMITMVDVTPCRPRPISKVRAARQGLAATQRSWASRSSAPLSTLRQPNADARYEALQQQTNKHNATVAKTQDEVAKAPARPTKRVKVDQLLYIPHNRPGECEGTFRVPDIDSDDEMEVDIDVPLRPNLFAETTPHKENNNATKKPIVQDKPKLAKQTTPKAASVTSSVTQPAARSNKHERRARLGRLNQDLYNAKRFLKHSEPQYHDHYKNKLDLAEQALKQFQEQLKHQPGYPESDDDEELPPVPVYHFPRIGKFAPPGPKDPVEQKYKASKFRFGLLHWQRTGQLIQGLY